MFSRHAPKLIGQLAAPVKPVRSFWHGRTSIYRATPGASYAGPIPNWNFTTGTGFIEAYCNFYQYVDGSTKDKAWNQLDQIHAQNYLAYMPDAPILGFYTGSGTDGPIVATTLRAKVGLRFEDAVNVFSSWETIALDAMNGADYQYRLIGKGESSGSLAYLMGEFLRNAEAEKTLVSGVCYRIEWTGLADPAFIASPPRPNVYFWPGDER